MPIPIKLRSRLAKGSRVRITQKKIAEVQTTREKLNAAKARKGHCEVEPSSDKPVTLRATIDMKLQVEANPEVWLPNAMRQICQDSGVTLTQESSPDGLDFGRWKMMTDFEVGWTGNVLVQCEDKTQLYSLHRAVHNKGLHVQGHSTTINIHSDYVDLGNCFQSDL